MHTLLKINDKRASQLVGLQGLRQLPLQKPLLGGCWTGRGRGGGADGVQTAQDLQAKEARGP